jgi:hypothetical protein
MAIDLSIIAPKARENYLRIGRQFGSTDTINQASKTLEGCEKYLDMLKLHGFSAANKQRLVDARQELIAAGVDRAEQVGHNKVTNKAFVAALMQGKEARQSGRSILESARGKLLENDDDTTAPEIEATIEQTRTSQDDPEKLATQLDLLRKTLSFVAVVAVTGDSGGPEAIADLEAGAGALRDTAQGKASGGTVGATENIDILDGIIVSLARSARKAARAAARKLRQPALAAAFELSHLYDKRSTSSTDTPNPAPGSSTG